MAKRKLGLLGKPAVSKRAKHVVPSTEGPLVAKTSSEQGSTEKSSASKRSEKPQARKFWGLESQLHRQSVSIISKLLSAQSTTSRGATVKGLCLAPHVQNKAAVYAVVCETLRHVPILQKLLKKCEVLSLHEKVRSRPVMYMPTGYTR